jgi:3-hydroxyisobutyrate dehydrogenase
MRVGVAGLGKMGSAMAARLKDAGADVVVWNRTRERADATGLPVADSPRALAEQVDTVITMLFDDPAVLQVFRGASGLLEAAPGKLFIEMSTVRPATHEHLADNVRRAGGAYVECPVGGSTGPARSGKLLGLVGGEDVDVTRARPVLDLLCRRVEHVGKVGAGASAKLAINLPLLVFWQAFGEANALIRHLKLDPEFVVELFADTSGGANVLKARGPAIAAALAGKDPGPPSFDVDSIRKDLRTMLAEAADHGFSLPVSERTLTAFDEAAASGLGKRDCSLLPAYWAAKADRPVDADA